jgi:hypothetical protein
LRLPAVLVREPIVAQRKASDGNKDAGVGQETATVLHVERQLSQQLQRRTPYSCVARRWLP